VNVSPITEVVPHADQRHAVPSMAKVVAHADQRPHLLHLLRASEVVLACQSP
jgi:hypothetical protein